MRPSKFPSANPYFIFFDHFRINLQKRDICHLKPISLAKIAGRKWREMTTAQKSVFVQIAEINRARLRARGRPSVPVVGLGKFFNV
uniref:Uncharacterized protein, isoform C n=1 Tax=Drosophila melanogaster TaxID=7227 RepID=A0A6M3Q7W0_DROME|nr:uncharacterized protein Dmel_CG46428, isoform C [Drosophila melanogaster]QJC18719.1 uncharacterized protein Dmel_CG14480, isoform C [Drosophila melanogaster]